MPRVIQYQSGTGARSAAAPSVVGISETPVEAMFTAAGLASLASSSAPGGKATPSA